MSEAGSDYEEGIRTLVKNGESFIQQGGRIVRFGVLKVGQSLRVKNTSPIDDQRIHFTKWALEEAGQRDELGLVALDGNGGVVGALAGRWDEAVADLPCEMTGTLVGKATTVNVMGALGTIPGAGTCLLLRAAQLALARGNQGLAIMAQSEAEGFYEHLGCALWGEAIEGDYDSFEVYGWWGKDLQRIVLLAEQLGIGKDYQEKETKKRSLI